MGARRYEIYHRVEHEKINFISPSSHVLFYLLYKFRSIVSKGEYSKGLIIMRISGHMCLIRYQNTCVLIRNFSVAKIPITHCSLYNKIFYLATCMYKIYNDEAKIFILYICEENKVSYINVCMKTKIMLPFVLRKTKRPVSCYKHFKKNKSIKF